MKVLKGDETLPVTNEPIASRLVNEQAHGERTRQHLREIRDRVADGYGYSAHHAAIKMLEDIHFLLTFFRDAPLTPVDTRADSGVAQENEVVIERLIRIIDAAGIRSLYSNKFTPARIAETVNDLRAAFKPEGERGNGETPEHVSLHGSTGNAVGYTRDDKVEEAIAAERERCARVAEGFYKPMRYRVNPFDVANAIRSQGSTQEVEDKNKNSS